MAVPFHTGAVGASGFIDERSTTPNVQARPTMDPDQNLKSEKVPMANLCGDAREWMGIGRVALAAPTSNLFILMRGERPNNRTEFSTI